MIAYRVGNGFKAIICVFTEPFITKRYTVRKLCEALCLTVSGDTGCNVVVVDLVQILTYDFHTSLCIRRTYCCDEKLSTKLQKDRYYDLYPTQTNHNSICRWLWHGENNIRPSLRVENSSRYSQRTYRIYLVRILLKVIQAQPWNCILSVFTGWHQSKYHQISLTYREFGFVCNENQINLKCKFAVSYVRCKIYVLY